LAERLLERSNIVTFVALGALSLLGWAWLMAGAGMSGMTADFFVIAGMWATMMVAMMTPSVVPTVLLYARAGQLKDFAGRPPTAAFVVGYLLVWAAFSVVAAGLQIGLHRASLTSSMTMALTGPNAASAVMVVVGVYQLLPIKDACLGRCRSPAQFLSRHYRPGAGGALRLGVLHGAYCVACCWLLMALLFVGGVMNLLWIAGLTLLVAAEKILPRGQVIAHVAGVVLIGWGIGRLLV
jgi:predicted metal-binding membrane protein